MNRLAAFWTGRRASTSIEYGLLAALISLIVVGSLTSTGSKTSKTFSKIGSSLN